MTAAPPRTLPMLRLLYGVFFLSGAAGLMYEAVWTRYLGLFVGNDAYAQVLVLVIFLGGMSLGATLVSRRAERFGNPLLWYALLEGATGVIGLLFHDAFVASTTFAYTTLFPALAGSAMLGFAKWGLASALILPQSILLGTTFPLMSAGALRRAPSEPGRVLGWLYFTNSIGAAVGVLVAGFVLVGLVGLPGVLVTAAILNLLAALATIGIGRNSPTTPRVSRSPQATFGPPSADAVARLLLASAFITAVASFCYEIVWIRMLSLLIGSATHSFELMLSAFILGLALGALWIRRNADRFAVPIRSLAIIQVAMGLLAMATLPLYAAAFHALEFVMAATSRTESGYLVFTLFRYGLCLAVMLPATICAGMTLPLITSVLLGRRRGEAAIGQVYAVNTVGSILGVALAGLVLLPVVGLKGLVVFGGGVDILLGVVLFRVATPSKRTVTGLGLAALTVGGIVAVTSFDRTAITSGVFRSGHVIPKGNATMRYYADGRTATVSVSESPVGLLVLATNGKSDASLNKQSRAPCDSTRPRRSLEGDETTQLLLGLLPLAYDPAAVRAAVIGLGAGMTSNALLSSANLRELVTIEIEPRMIDGARLFFPANRRTFDDPRSRLVVDDAKSYFAATAHQWDIIVSEPSNPWVSGVSGLFTEEFYRRIRGHLAPGGIFAQWVQAYEVDDQLLLSVLTAFHRAFPEWSVHQVGVADLVLIGSRDGALPAPDYRALLASPALAVDLCGALPLSADALESSRLAGRRLLQPVIERFGTANSDFYPLLDLGAEKRRFESGTAIGMLALGDRWFNLSRALTDMRQPPVELPGLLFLGLRRSLAEWERTWQARSGGLDSLAAPWIAQARQDWANWNTLIAVDKPPEDWRPWLQQLQEVTRVRHAGTAGWIDTALWNGAIAYALRHHAPARVRAVLEFRRGVQGWNAPATLAAAAVLADSATIAEGWIGGDELQDGAVVAALREGDRALAQEWYIRLARFSARPPSDLRSLILRAWATGGATLPPE